jgi:alkylation response protein AidB-like acyl-CoA dehydrogenase
VDFALSETQEIVRKTAHEFAVRYVAPEAAERDETEQFPSRVMRGLADLGLLAIHVPRDLGGSEAGPIACALAIREIARACASTAVMMSVTNMVGEAIARFGTEAQKRRHCPRLADGTYGVGSFALSEPDVGSDPAGLRTAARRDGGGWVLDGAKQWITGGSDAGIFVVWARTAPKEAGTKGLACFLVEAGTRGLTVGPPADKMGLRASSTVALHFDGCKIPGDALLGEDRGGFKIAMVALDGGRVGIASQAEGIARAALDESVTYAHARTSFGAPIAERQAIKWKLADMRVALDAAHLLTMRAAWLKESAKPFTREASMAKLVATEAAVRVCNDAVQIHGGYGFIRDFAVERHLRDARATTLYEGTSEIQRLVIARSVLG